jgi:hypothetical protein
MTPLLPAAAGLAAGLAIAAVDTFAAGGHVSPIVIVALLILATGGIGGTWGWRAWPGALAAGLPVPVVHLVKHALGLPDTIQPNTYDSIAMMGLFTLAVTGAGFVAGVVLRQAAVDEP